MKINQKHTSSFNGLDTVLVISKYPYQSIPESHHGVATYTQKSIAFLTKHTDKKAVILVEKEYQRSISKESKGVVVIPSFSNSNLWWTQVLKWVLHFDKVKIIHIHSEFYHNGSPFQLIGTIPFLIISKLLGKKVFFIAHNIIDDFSFIANHLGKKRKSVFINLLERVAPVFYKLISVLSFKVVVLDESILKRLAKFVSPSQIILSPHIIPKRTPRTLYRKSFRNKLGYNDNDFVLICYGFMTSYKGVDWVASSLHQLSDSIDINVKLLLVGGKAPSQTGKKHYERYYSKLESLAKNYPDITLTGFVDESDISKYFAAADLAIFPYKGILGASGSWTEALSNNKAFILSTHLSAYLQSDDIKSIMDKQKLTQNDITFELNIDDLRRKIEYFASDKNKLSKIEKLSKQISISRSPKNCLKNDLNSIYAIPVDTKGLFQWKSYEWFKKIPPTWQIS